MIARVLVIIGSRRRFLIYHSVRFRIFGPLVRNFLSNVRRDPFLRIFRKFVFLCRLLRLSFLLREGCGPRAYTFSFLTLCPRYPLVRLRGDLCRDRSRSKAYVLYVCLVGAFGRIVCVFFKRTGAYVTSFRART